MDLKGGGREGVGWLNLAQGMGQWRNDVNMVMNLLVS
jgi:hypothetical protein